VSLPAHPERRHPFLYRSIVLPVLALLRMGASPEKLAWSISLGLVVGVNPLLGSTTLLCLGLALLFRLNLPASQLANHLMYPVEIVLLFPFLKFGAFVFQTGPIPLAPSVLFAEVRSHPLALVKSVWLWEWHALATWAIAALVLLPLIAAILTPVLRRMLVRVEAHHAALAAPVSTF
jgi:uncharacterized protein (DUF2062 family)